MTGRNRHLVLEAESCLKKHCFAKNSSDHFETNLREAAGSEEATLLAGTLLLPRT